MTEPTDAIERLTELWRQAERVVVLTGAGMSTESGLPDFRSAGGMWRTNRRFEELASVDALRRCPEDFDAFYRWRIENLLQHEPHAGHFALAQLEQQGKLHTLITQNVDGFHQAAGSKNVVALHGSLRSVHCQSCRNEVPASAFLEPQGSHCAVCGGKLRPSVVLFGEGLDQALLNRAFAESSQADLFVVLGSSLAVSPANLLPEVAQRSGAAVAIVNLEATHYRGTRSVEIQAQIGPTLQALCARLESPTRS